MRTEISLAAGETQGTLVRVRAKRRLEGRWLILMGSESGISPPRGILGWGIPALRGAGMGIGISFPAPPRPTSIPTPSLSRSSIRATPRPSPPLVRPTTTVGEITQARRPTNPAPASPQSATRGPINEPMTAARFTRDASQLTSATGRCLPQPGASARKDDTPAHARHPAHSSNHCHSPFTAAANDYSAPQDAWPRHACPMRLPQSTSHH
ncbi:hypothetical protein J5N97_011962 [Dioscorea zingiberensis]|uniref:Uncharacterized protein n=1 Tax=Dioscorea zingiberensis TaxID=325984 RepID=A0A9D5D3D6_9LILI|nr:hypothetical protein J5N97_011962 [Dioscorea zingiberensis]